MPWWGWVLVGWGVASVVTAPIIGKLLKRNRLRVEDEEQFWKDQVRRSAARWN